jgi:hypothetical protein
VNTKIKWKRDIGYMVFDEMVEVINLTEDNKKFLEVKQQHVKEFLEKFTDNNFLNILKNIYQPNQEYNSFIQINILEDEKSFKEFIRVKYKAGDGNVSGVQNHTNYKIYFQNALQDLEQIVKNIKTKFLNCGYVVAKMQLRFSVILEGPTVEDEGTQIISDYSGNQNISILKSMSL